MTRRARHASPSPELSRASEASTYKNHHHRKTPKQSSYYDDDGELSASVTGPSTRFLPLLSSVNSSASSTSPINPPHPHIKTQTDSSYISIAPFPIFRGTPGECPVSHLSRFAKVCRANNVSSIEMAIKIFPVTLEDEAALWYDLNVEPCPSLTWEQIKSSFLGSYQKIDYDRELGSELMAINQGDEESVRSYFLKLQLTLDRWPDHGIPDPLVKEIFIDGLREEFRDWIIPQKPESLDDALRLAFTWEQVRCIRGVRRNAEVRCGFCGGAHKESECKIRGKLREWWLNTTSKEEEEEDEEATENHVRSVSAGDERSGVGRDEERDEEVGVLGQNNKIQCQCSKHRCWKKRLERNTSAVTVNSNNGAGF